MRRAILVLAILVVGIALIVGGFVVLEVPVIQHASKTVTASTPAKFRITERVALLSDDLVSASWSSNASVTLVARTCSSIDSSATTVWGQCTGGSNVTKTGSSGSWTTSVPVGGYLWVVLLNVSGSGSNQSASISVSNGYQFGALGLWGLGGLFVIVGAFLRTRKKSTAAVEPVAAVGPSAKTGPASGPATPASEPAEPVPIAPQVPGEVSEEEPLD